MAAIECYNNQLVCRESPECYFARYYAVLFGIVYLVVVVLLLSLQLESNIMTVFDGSNELSDNANK